MADPRRRGGMDASQDELQDRRLRLARGESPAAIAKDWGRSPSTLYKQSSDEKDLIARIRDGLLDVMDGQAALSSALSWVTDVVRSSQVYEADADRLHELSYDPGLAPRDVSRYLRDATHIANKAHELNEMLKSRAQVQVETDGRASIEIVGVDVGALAAEWQLQPHERPMTVPGGDGEAPMPHVATPDAESDVKPLGPIPEKWAGKGAGPSAVVDPQYEPYVEGKWTHDL
jgi:hypothetical protein